jgi:hypothetical protein
LRFGAGSTHTASVCLSGGSAGHTPATEERHRGEAPRIPREARQPPAGQVSMHFVRCLSKSWRSPEALQALSSHVGDWLTGKTCRYSKEKAAPVLDWTKPAVGRYRAAMARVLDNGGLSASVKQEVVHERRQGRSPVARPVVG